MSIIYLSGPMTGLPNRNAETFNRWARYLRDRGHQVISPVENDGGSTDKPRSFYMELDINSLLMSNVVVLLPNWQYSRGAKLEVAIAQEIGRKLYTIDEFIKPNSQQTDPDVTINVII